MQISLESSGWTEAATSDSSAVDVGRGLGASHIVTGSAQAVDGRLRVRAPLLETPGGICFPIAYFLTRMIKRDEDRERLFGDLAQARLAVDELCQAYASNEMPDLLRRANVRIWHTLPGSLCFDSRRQTGG